MKENGGRPKQTVLFICAQNSARSQMAEALLRKLYGDKYDVFSAGVKASTVNPYAVLALTQIGADTRTLYSKSLDLFADRDFDYVITVCDKVREICPFFPGRNIIHHGFIAADTTGSDEEILRDFIRLGKDIENWLVERFGP